MINICLIIYFSIVFISAMTGTVRFKSITVPVKMLTVLLWIVFIAESTAEYLSRKMNNNTQVYHFYVIVAFWLYALIYFNIFQSVKIKGLVFITAIGFTLFCLINSLFYQKLASVPSINLTLSNVILVIFSLVYLKNSVNLDPFQSISKSSLFWFNTSVLIYFTIQLFIWGILDYLITTGKNVVPLIIFGLIISIFFYAALGISIFLDRPKKASGSHDNNPNR